MRILSFDGPAWLGLIVLNPSSHDGQALVDEAMGFSVLFAVKRWNSPRWDGTIGTKKLVVEIINLGIREDHPALEVVNAHASHDAPQGSRFQRRGKR